MNLYENSSPFSLISFLRATSQFFSVFVLLSFSSLFFFSSSFLLLLTFALLRPLFPFNWFNSKTWVNMGFGFCSFSKLLICELHLAQSLLPFDIVSFLSFSYCCFWGCHFAMRALTSCEWHCFIHDLFWLYLPFASISYIFRSTKKWTTTVKRKQKKARKKLVVSVCLAKCLH